MGRGPSQQTVDKKLRHKIRVEQKEKWKLEEDKPLEVSFREHMGKFIDRISLTEAVELGAIVGLTFLLKPMLQTSAEVVKSIGARAETIATEFETWSGKFMLTTWGWSWVTIFRVLGVLPTGHEEDKPEISANEELITTEELKRRMMGMSALEQAQYAHDARRVGDKYAVKTGELKTLSEAIGEQEMFWYMLAFVVAVLIIKLGPSIIATFGNVTGMATSLLGLAAAA